jgi:Ca-activated chloride channel family protein
MRFAQPLWLLVGAFAVVLLLILRVRSELLTTRAMRVLSGARLVEAKALPSRFRRWLRVAVVSFAVAMGFVALARPQKGMQWQTLDRQGTDVLLVVDTSKSMNAGDVRPTRLERTKLAVRDLVERFPGDRIGLVAFAGDAFVESPMTLDHDALLETLSAFDTSIIAHGGTDIGRAIDVGASALKADSGNQKVMVLLTDGEDLENQGLEAAKRAGEAGITIETVGVGTPAGELVPATNDATNGKPATVGLVRDESGAPVRSRLDEPGLRAIAQAAHGTYRPLGTDGRGLDRLYDEVLAPLAHTEHGARVRRVYAEWFAVPLSLSIFGVVLDALLGWRPRSRPRARRTRSGSGLGRTGVMAAIAVVLFLPARAYASVKDAEKAFAAGKFDDAAREYDAEQARHPKDARLAIDAGAAAYRAGHYDAAEAAFGKALTTADPKLQQQVLYDLGDARYRLGATTIADAPEKTKERWKSAIAAYEGALALAPSDADAVYNRDFVKRKLAELEAKQKPQPQESQAKEDQAKKGSSGQDQSKGSSGQDQAKGGTGQEQAKGGTGDKDATGKNGGTSDRPAGTSSSPSQAPADAKGGQGQGGAQDRVAASGQTQGPAPRGAASARHAGSASSASGGGSLTPDEARALLGSLRGDERRGVSSATSGAPVTTDAPRKDW